MRALAATPETVTLLFTQAPFAADAKSIVVLTTGKWLGTVAVLMAVVNCPLLMVCVMPSPAAGYIPVATSATRSVPAFAATVPDATTQDQMG